MKEEPQLLGTLRHGFEWGLLGEKEETEGFCLLLKSHTWFLNSHVNRENSKGFVPFGDGGRRDRTTAAKRFLRVRVLALIVLITC